MATMSVIRLKEVAAEAGVSIATTSMALNGSSAVKPDTRIRVEAAARKLGYQKNSAAAVLSSSQNRNSRKSVFIAWLTAGTLSSSGRLEGAFREAEKLGVQMEFCNIRRSNDLKAVIRSLYARGCDGVVLGRGMALIAGQEDWSRFCIVSVEEGLFEEGVDVVRSSLFRSTYELLWRVREVGYKRVGVCLREHDPLHPDDATRLGATLAFQTAEMAHAERIPPKRISLMHCKIAEELIPWVRKYQPDVVIGFSGAELWALRDGGFPVPEGLAYVALHVLAAERGPLAGYQDNLEVYPPYAVRVLFEKIRHGVRGLSDHPQQTLVLPPLLQGESCPRLN
ncbi:Catabolite control protein A [Pontiella desulfatans]|uniref:Catabolite control protein A n=1 Tax=Pontiella desulfatans TaxID=2750659 RepID=A0A6C2U586_PONDE|nr:LacI family DNA-binding transcriptional regulator [Pontiella desulfatans]VGO15065.1 Catabolite control protein A [Pontiella desulfatans]